MLFFPISKVNVIYNESDTQFKLLIFCFNISNDSKNTFMKLKIEPT